MKNIVILAAGPPKGSRNRHLEVFEGEILIDKVISRCRVDDTDLYVVVDSSNDALIKHLSNIDNVTTLHPKDQKIYSTFEVALSVSGDCVMVAGDLISLREGDVNKFVNSEHRSATCKYANPWGANPKSVKGSMVRRADVGDCINMIAEEHKDEFLSDANYQRALTIYDNFYGYRTINPYFYNDIGTFMSFAFYEGIWSDPAIDSVNGKGLVLFHHNIYNDND